MYVSNNSKDITYVDLNSINIVEKKRVYLTRKILEPAISLLAAKYQVSIHDSIRPPTRLELRKGIRNMDGILCTLSDKMDKKVLYEAGPNLKVISSYSTGYDHIDVAEATKRGVVVATNGDVLAEATADLTFALILAISAIGF